MKSYASRSRQHQRRRERMAEIEQGTRVVVVGPGEAGIVESLYRKHGIDMAEVRMDYWPRFTYEFQLDSLEKEGEDG
jgi:preprotein translocase subunit YajC